MSGELEGKVAIVTGAATGSGKAIAHAFGAAGARVFVNYLDTPDPAEAVVAQISRDGGEALAVAADVSSRARFETLVTAAIVRFGRWDVLVNNAGIALVKSAVTSPTTTPWIRTGRAVVRGPDGGSRAGAEESEDDRSERPGTRSCTCLRSPG
jgi:NAD(P)-dependent dehydrogenase (short-subunit alcohol dehydrogenase family)